MCKIEVAILFLILAIGYDYNSFWVWNETIEDFIAFLLVSNLGFYILVTYYIEKKKSVSVSTNQKSEEISLWSLSKLYLNNC